MQLNAWWKRDGGNVGVWRGLCNGLASVELNPNGKCFGRIRIKLYTQEPHMEGRVGNRSQKLGRRLQETTT